MDTEVTLAELASRSPGAVRVLERHGLDYCCGGRRTLAEACASADVGLAMVVGELERAAVGRDAAPDWAGLAPAELVDHLEAVHHRYLDDELPRLTRLADKVAEVHGRRHPELLRVATLVADLRADLEPHLRKEELVLFPMVRELDGATRAPAFHCGSVANPIRVMLVEHDRAGALLAELRAVTGGYVVPDDGCASYRALYDGLAELEADTHLHVHKENNVLFPAVLAAERALAAGAP